MAIIHHCVKSGSRKCHPCVDGYFGHSDYRIKRIEKFFLAAE